ncbi:hypothetical protein [Filimonas effusa]|uniref:Uncharacterized protein n=1 Tax=Filimonas effusa TaxID=2508721 RepID=A0A4Q1DDE3_9BACT|nr:hypothetical protein [Filimonas effusa]RXK86895.1 hypothetical protein ESB13_08925 [Filimonas effusa]
MNEQPLYERQIASKLEQLPVPDMADAIWLRIKDQLDADMPSDGSAQTPPLPPPTRPRNTKGGKLGLLGFIVATIVLIYFIKPQKQDKVLPSTPVQTQTDSTPLTPVQPVDPPGQPRRSNPVASPLVMPKRPVDTTSPVLQQQSTQPDTTAPTPPLPQPTQLLPPVNPVRKDTVPAKKKPRGVQGINDSDYKIVPKMQP